MTQQTPTMETGGQQGGGGSPVDNNTYNLLQVLTSKLEAIEAYGKYERDANEQSRSLFQQLKQQDEQSVQQLVEALRGALSSEGGGSRS
jgi:hypothetical protein